MAIISILCLSFVVVLNSIDSSYQSDCSPNGDPSPGTPYIRKSSNRLHSPSSSFTTNHPASGSSHIEGYPVAFPESEFYPPASPPLEFSDIVMPFPGTNSLQTPRSPAQSTVRSRSRSPPPNLPPAGRSIVPPTMLPSVGGFRYGIAHIEFYRLISYANPKLIFQLQRYTFPVVPRIKFKTEHNSFLPLPGVEQIVLSTPNEDVFAILRESEALAGIYILPSKRVKMNMRSGRITKLTKEEIAETPVGRRRPITTYFKVVRVDHV